MLSTEAEDWQWWKLGYDRGEWEPVSRMVSLTHILPCGLRNPRKLFFRFANLALIYAESAGV
jgi:hypothetical protein